MHMSTARKRLMKSCAGVEKKRSMTVGGGGRNVMLMDRLHVCEIGFSPSLQSRFHVSLSGVLIRIGI